jgi:hypothetical protein
MLNNKKKRIKNCNNKIKLLINQKKIKSKKDFNNYKEKMGKLLIFLGLLINNHNNRMNLQIKFKKKLKNPSLKVKINFQKNKLDNNKKCRAINLLKISQRKKMLKNKLKEKRKILKHLKIFLINLLKILNKMMLRILKMLIMNNNLLVNK